jgi:hypothetical protein
MRPGGFNGEGMRIGTLAYPRRSNFRGGSGVNQAFVPH